MAFTGSPCLRSTAKMSSMVSPGSITMASRDCSSPKIEQLHCSIPTGRISWIIHPRLYTRGMDAALPIAMRWLHIASVVILLGGVFYARFTAGSLDTRFKPVAYAAIGGILGSGLYNFLSKTVYPPHYHMWFGIKMLLALHVFAIILVY